MAATVKLKNIDKYLDWYSSLDYESAKFEEQRLISVVKEYKKSNFVLPEEDAIRAAFSVSSWWSFPETETPEYKWTIQRDSYRKKYEQFISYVIDFEQEPHVGEWHDGGFAFLFLGNPQSGIIVTNPEEYLEYIPEMDYSNMTTNDVKKLLGATDAATQTSLIPTDLCANLTPSKAAAQLSVHEARIDELEQEIDGVKRESAGELAEMKAAIEKMQAELHAKKSEMLTELYAKKKEMEELKEKMELQIYLLDSQIYAIECYMGEVVKFARLRVGQVAPNTEPIVVHQKLRFLDEEMGKLASLYTIGWGEINLFEQFLAEHPVALDTFAPNKRCVVLIRLSRNNKIISSSDIPYTNILEDYKYYHGATVGIIIRNGDNLYLGWTDEDRIHIDDDLIVSQVIETAEPAKEMSHWEEDAYIKKQKRERKRLMDGIISRSFIYNILQGVVDNSTILPLPEGVKLDTPSEYVVYSVADKWLQDTRFGSFTDIIERCNQTVNQGDMIITVQRLVPEYGGEWNNGAHGFYRRWENPRGRGEANRIHDCSIDDGKIYPVNLVEYDKPVEMVRYSAQDGKTDMGWHTYKRETYVGDDGKIHMEGLSDGCVILEEYTLRHRHVFVSVKKTENWRRDEAYVRLPKANFEVMDNEFINLSFMNSVWLEAVITNKNLGNWRVGGKSVDYAYAIRYLKIAMDYIRKREEDEEKLIFAAYGKALPSEWQVALSEWKIVKNVRIINEYQAKRFARLLDDGV